MESVFLVCSRPFMESDGPNSLQHVRASVPTAPHLSSQCNTMSILNFLTQDEIDELSEDPQTAFMELVNIAQRSLSKQTKDLDTDDRNQWEIREDFRHSFMNVVIASAKDFNVEPFVSMSVPRRSDYREIDYTEFKADVDHYITQLVLRNSSRSRTESVVISQQTKDDIRSYIVGLRSCIENANLSEAKRSVLLDKLRAFEEQLEKKRLKTAEVAMFVFTVLGVPGSLWASYEITAKLTNNIMRTVAEAQAAEMETRRLPSAEPYKALSPPRADPAPRVRRASKPNYDLDDDLPF